MVLPTSQKVSTMRVPAQESSPHGDFDPHMELNERAVVSFHDPLSQCHCILCPKVCFVCVASTLLLGQVEGTVLFFMHRESGQHKIYTDHSTHGVDT